jgi:hypothetical protein
MPFPESFVLEVPTDTLVPADSLPKKETMFASALARADTLLGRATQPGDDWFLARLRLRLQLHRLGDQELDEQALATEVDQILDRIRREQRGTSQWLEFSPAAPLRTEDCVVRPVPKDWVVRICEQFHYVGTPRDGVAVGLYPAAAPESAPPATLLLFSELSPSDRELAARRLESEIPSVLLSRVYSFRWAPKNGFSYACRRALPLVRAAFPEAEVLLTQHDPNPGFTAASYRAANWTSLGSGRETVYHYLAGQYITDRELAQRFDSDSPSGPEARSQRHTRSHRPLLPHELWAFPLTAPARRHLQSLSAATHL